MPKENDSIIGGPFNIFAKPLHFKTLKS